MTSINQSTPVYTTRIAPGTETRRLSLENVNVERHRKLIHDVNFKINMATNLPNAMKSYFFKWYFWLCSAWWLFLLSLGWKVWLL